MAGALSKLPASIGSWKKASVSAGDPGVLYHDGGKTVSVGLTLMSAPYDDLAKLVTIKATKVDAGVCGSAMSEDNLTCYLKAADGTINISGSDDTKLPDLVAFANDLTKALPAS